MAMALHPEKLKLVQAEIDAVVGTDRLPVMNDRPNLPYLDAVIKETMRWHPALPLGEHSISMQLHTLIEPLGIARSVAEDDVYHGYHIPKGTIVIPNVW